MDFLLNTGINLDAGFFTFLVAITLLTMSPGVDTLVVIRNTLRGGFKDGAITSFAICLGLFVHAVISAGGISLILLQSAVLFAVLKVVGALYLIWLGYKNLKSAFRSRRGVGAGGALALSTATAQVSVWKSFREGFLSNVLNPKTIVFYMAFLPQFIQPEEPVMLKSLLLAGIHFVIANLWQLAVILMVAKAAALLSLPRVRAGVDATVGGFLAMMGVHLLMSDK